MTEISTGIHPPKPPELSKAERLSDEQMGNLLSAVGNHEAKAVTLILMRDGDIYDNGNLYRQVLNSQGNNKGWKISWPIPFKYCFYSLAPIGLVTKEAFGPDLTTSGYSITDYGKEVGIPLAGLLLDFSERHNIPLGLLFGSRVSTYKEETSQTDVGKDDKSKKRSPSTTLKILYELFTSAKSPMREADLATGVAENAGIIETHLIRLSELGLIQYKSRGANKSYSKHKLANNIPEGELPVWRDQPKLTKLVFDIVKNNPNQYLTNKDVYNLLPQEQKEIYKDEKVSISQISRVLSFLVRYKYAEIENFDRKKQSQINLTDEQRAVLSELLEITYRFQNNDREVIEAGKRLAEEIISNQERVAKLMERAREASSYANASHAEDTQQDILSIIFSNPSGVTAKEIKRFLEEKDGKKLRAKSVSVLSSSLVESGAIRVEKEGIVNRFYSNNKEHAAS